MPLSDLQKVQRIARAALGTFDWQITALGRGATSAAWYATNKSDDIIIRMIPHGTNRPNTYQSEFTILHMLKEKGCPVPQPILNSTRTQLAEVTEPWAVTRVVQGQAIQQSGLPLPAAKDLGRLIAVIHALPVEQYGRLVEQRYSICGLQADPISGIQARWCWANIWPFDHVSLMNHCIAHLAPHLVSKLDPFAPSILNMIQENPAVLNHSDLHGEHIFIQNQHLSGVIDFGVAFIGHPYWDFAVVAFYHGWDSLNNVLEGYAPSAKKRKRILEQTPKLALAVGLYKLSKAYRAKAPQQKRRKILDFVIQTANLMHA